MTGYRKIIFGIGINDADYDISKSVKVAEGKWRIVWTCPYYNKWRGVLERCFCPKLKVKRPTYTDVTCCKEWLTFSNFKSWMETQDWQGKHLDKDIIGNGKLYSPETCIFVTPLVNTCLLTNESTRGDHPLGVSFHKRIKKFAACISQANDIKTHLGYFNDAQDAHKVWQKAKVEVLNGILDIQTDLRVMEALNKVICKLKQDIQSGTETKTLNITR